MTACDWPVAVCSLTERCSGLIKEGCWVRRAGGTDVLANRLAGGHVADVVLDDPDALGGRRETDRADRVGLLDQDLPDLLGRLVPGLGVLASAQSEQLEHLHQLRVPVRLDA